MLNDLVVQAAMTVLRGIVVLVSHRSLIRSLTVYIFLFISISYIQPILARAGDFSNISKSPEQLMHLLKERLMLTEEQETKLEPLIDEIFKKHIEILKNGGQNGKSERSALQELQWSADMQIGKFLTDEQLKEYQKLREGENEKKTQASDTQGGRGKHAGRMRGF